jgi:hypothetical protein
VSVSGLVGEPSVEMENAFAWTPQFLHGPPASPLHALLAGLLNFREPCSCQCLVLLILIHVLATAAKRDCYQVE